MRKDKNQQKSVFPSYTGVICWGKKAKFGFNFYQRIKTVDTQGRKAEEKEGSEEKKKERKKLKRRNRKKRMYQEEEADAGAAEEEEEKTTET